MGNLPRGQGAQSRLYAGAHRGGTALGAAGRCCSAAHRSWSAVAAGGRPGRGPGTVGWAAGLGRVRPDVRRPPPAVPAGGAVRDLMVPGGP